MSKSVSHQFWRAKIKAIVEPLPLDISGLKNGLDLESQKYLDALANTLSESGSEADSVTKYVEDAKDINGASDRAAFSLLPTNGSGGAKRVKHLLSGKPLKLNLTQSWSELQHKSQEREVSAESRVISDRELFWWLWRCLPQAIADNMGSESALIPAIAILPDASIWSDASLTAALAGSLAGYPREQNQSSAESQVKSQPYLAIFSFSPVQELIKASRKMRDFWAGSWLLHYLSAKICWRIAQKYGADSLVYPSLYQQPLIDRWLLKEYPDFDHWIVKPKVNSLLTAGFPNVIVMVLPQAEVEPAMQTARQNLLDEWSDVGKGVFSRIKNMMPELKDESDPRWHDWLKAQWQTYWSALPIGKQDIPLVNEKFGTDEFKAWLNQQNEAYNLKDDKKKLFSEVESEFVEKVSEGGTSVKVNVGSWWPFVFDQLRFSLASVKTARHWKLPTAFKTRSTVSGMGSAIALGKRGSKENLGLFDGKEQLNATEIVKRGLHLVLSQLLDLSGDEREFAASYPDLCSGVAGWLRGSTQAERDYYLYVCEKITQKFVWTTQGNNNPADFSWGIPWIDDTNNPILSNKYNPRLLNPGWLIEDFPQKEDRSLRQQELNKLTNQINRYFPPGNNPTDWYVLGKGDGDSLGKWLKGSNLLKYKEYLNSSAIALPKEVVESFNELEAEQKRMGPSTHNALSRALLDFSNQLVPYLTEQRYTGRLIYSGGDDVFAYSNLWEWDKWLWDIRQCFCGAKDPEDDFDNGGDYWKWQKGELPSGLSDRPLFTMGSEATISFGIVIAHHSVPLAIALESLWEAEEKAKEHFVKADGKNLKKNAVQARVMFGNGNTLKATSKFTVFNEWRSLLEKVGNITKDNSSTLPAFFEQAALVWSQHPAPDQQKQAIEVWTTAFCARRDIFQNEAERDEIAKILAEYLSSLGKFTKEEDWDKEIANWLKLAAFILRKRQILVKTAVMN
ncbi:MAG: type III-B CRISPR-associated protein Cas10/Cmr2 [Cyanobacteria bacterium J06621_12]